MIWFQPSVSPSGVHAPSATPDGKGGVIIIFNMNPGRPTEGWNQIMTLPRRLTLIAKDELGQEPAGDIASLRYNAKHIGATKLPANQEIVLNNISGNAMEISAEIDPKNSQMIEMNVLRSPRKEEYTRIIFFKEKDSPTDWNTSQDHKLLLCRLIWSAWLQARSQRQGLLIPH